MKKIILPLSIIFLVFFSLLSIYFIPNKVYDLTKIDLNDIKQFTWYELKKDDYEILDIDYTYDEERIDKEIKKVYYYNLLINNKNDKSIIVFKTYDKKANLLDNSSSIDIVGKFETISKDKQDIINSSLENRHYTSYNTMILYDNYKEPLRTSKYLIIFLTLSIIDLIILIITIIKGYKHK